MNAVALVLVLLLGVLGCAEPTMVEHDPIPLGTSVAYCADSEIDPCVAELPSRIWGARPACEPGAIPVHVEDLEDGLLGLAFTRSRVVLLDPDAVPSLGGRWDGSLVLAHELGHLYGLLDGGGECDLMREIHPSYRCTSLEVLGASYDYSPGDACRTEVVP